ncbi:MULTISPECIES: transporter gate domain-containing protein [unclassified Haloferax]|uniref:transporter gate domain-containing protein n=1 Tax=unclassified Haloferax TaxID=2625095 RepID=UPI0002AFF57D|nr:MULTISPECIES: transporter gate domain-containing protein [unclassified Haloferax]ELZ57508.1 transporter gate domain-containing protein [Haloferax sp. ATCC BAA-646]ELZ62477.1 transporter gate domain-containing protein [Haloferax sp. ATCC BAA-645]ELZ65051.1 transporter gate domain-containing protein [Haloferax sp. ATCC BAA-644]
MQPSAVLPVLFEVLPRVARIAAYIAVGVFAANLVVAFGLVERIAGLSRYLTSPANLPDEVGTAIVTTAASTTAGYGMLAEFRESGVLDDRATLVAVTINTFFGFVQHIFTFYWPVLIPILGREVGFMYVGARAAIALAITATGVVAGAVLLSDRNTTPVAVTETDGSGGAVDAVDSAADPGDSGDAAESDDSLREMLEDAARSTWQKLRRIVPRLAVVYVAVTLLLRTTDLESFAALASPLTNLVGLPGAAVPVVVAFAFDTTTGAATIAPAIGETFTPRQAVATMLIGGIISFAVSTFKRSIPFQYGIWSPEFGSKVIAVNTGLKIVFIAVAVALLVA